MSEKPMRVEVGQKWRTHGKPFIRDATLVVRKVDCDFVRYDYEHGAKNFSQNAIHFCEPKATFLGYAPGLSSPTPAPAPVSVSFGIVWQGSIDGKTWCEMPQHKAVEYPKSREYIDGELAAEFYRDEAGRFHAIRLNHRPISPQPSPVAPTKRCDRCGVEHSRVISLCRECDALLEAECAAPPVYGRMVGEMRALDGSPKTALEAIQARKKPDPWRPSCDEDFWIPDAGT